MANYTQYIPQVNSTTYPVSITNCFTALTTDVTALENGKVDLINASPQTIESEIIIQDDLLKIQKDGPDLQFIRPTGGTAAEARIQIYDDAVLDSTFGWHYTDLNWYFNNSVSLNAGNLVVDIGDITATAGTIYVGADEVAVKGAALSNTFVVSADASGRLDTSSGIVAANIVERSGTLTSGQVPEITTGNDIQNSGVTVVDLATLSGTQTITGTKTFSAAPTFSAGLVTAGDILNTVSNGDITISGDTTSTTGANIKFHGASHAILPNNILIRQGSTDKIGLDNTGHTTFYDEVSFSGTAECNSTLTLYKGADVGAAVGVLTLGNGNYFDINTTAGISSIASKGVGTVVKLHFDAILTLTHHATDLILPGGVNITTAAGDEAEFVEYATGDWRCTSYQKAAVPPSEHYPLAINLGGGHTSITTSGSAATQVTVNHTATAAGADVLITVSISFRWYNLGTSTNDIYGAFRISDGTTSSSDHDYYFGDWPTGTQPFAQIPITMMFKMSANSTSQETYTLWFEANDTQSGSNFEFRIGAPGTGDEWIATAQEY